MTDRPEQLLWLSARLTGFDPFQLRSTGMLHEYVDVLDARLPAGVLDEILAHGNDETSVDAVMSDRKLGPVARNLILLWYCGSWTRSGRA